ncbi:Uncharacterised protein [Mycobacteroides abscessus subsp. abscessus]|nr:Uncharacterised protein [Mycobacteroides abscessus subsp. abscessus]
MSSAMNPRNRSCSSIITQLCSLTAIQRVFSSQNWSLKENPR